MSMMYVLVSLVFFFFNDTATTEIYTLSLHDALPISVIDRKSFSKLSGVLDRVDDDPALSIAAGGTADDSEGFFVRPTIIERSEEHTSELQSRQYLVCRLLLEKKKNITSDILNTHICD